MIPFGFFFSFGANGSRRWAHGVMQIFGWALAAQRLRYGYGKTSTAAAASRTICGHISTPDVEVMRRNASTAHRVLGMRTSRVTVD